MTLTESLTLAGQHVECARHLMDHSEFNAVLSQGCGSETMRLKEYLAALTVASRNIEDARLVIWQAIDEMERQKANGSATNRLAP